VAADSDFTEELISTDFMNTTTASGVPPHELHLKVGMKMMILRNLNDSLANGTIVVVAKIGRDIVFVNPIHRDNNGKAFLSTECIPIPRITFEFEPMRGLLTIARHQFPLRAAYAMTINKSQGQTLARVALDLRRMPFAHGQLYVALGRVRCAKSIIILVSDDQVYDGRPCTRNVVNTQLLRLAHQTMA